MRNPPGALRFYVQSFLSVRNNADSRCPGIGLVRPKGHTAHTQAFHAFPLRGRVGSDEGEQEYYMKKRFETGLF